MKVLPFPCVRPVPEHVDEVVAWPADALDGPAGADVLAAQQAGGALMYDPSRSYYVVERATTEGVVTGVVGICTTAAYEDGTIAWATEATETDVQARAESICSLGAQAVPVVAGYADQPVLDIIIGAAKGSTPLYAFISDDGARCTVWEVRRTDAVEALKAMFEQVPNAHAVNGTHAAASVAATRILQNRAQEEGELTGTEPFNFILTALFPASALCTADTASRLEGMLANLFIHRIAR